MSTARHSDVILFKNPVNFDARPSVSAVTCVTEVSDMVALENVINETHIAKVQMNQWMEFVKMKIVSSSPSKLMNDQWIFHTSHCFWIRLLCCGRLETPGFFFSKRSDDQEYLDVFTVVSEKHKGKAVVSREGRKAALSQRRKEKATRPQGGVKVASQHR